MKADKVIYTWHCPKCAHKGRNLFKPLQQLCDICDEPLIYETMIPLYLFD